MKDETRNQIPPLSQMTAEWLSALSESTDHNERLIGFLTFALIESKLIRDLKTAEALLKTLLSLSDLPATNRTMLLWHLDDVNSIRSAAEKMVTD